MFSTLVLLSWWLLLRALRRRTTWSWVWYGVTAAAMQLTHPFAPLVLGIEAGVVAVLAWRARRTDTLKPLLRGYVVAVLVGIILVIPWYAYGALDWVDGIRSGKRYGFNAKGSGYSVPVDRALFTRMGEWLLGNSRGISVLVVVLVVVIVAAPFLARGRDRATALYALAYTLGFMLVLIPLARTIGTYFAYRRIESLVPPLLLAAAIGIVAGVERLVGLRVDRKVAFAVGAVVLAVILGLSLAATIEYYGTEKSNYREMARIIRHTRPDEDVVITANADPTRILEYLSWQDVHRPVTFVIKNDPPELPATMKKIVWFTGVPPDREDMKTRALNDLEKMQIVAGDSSGPLAILPWFESRSEPGSQAQLDEQGAAVSRLPHLLPPP
jgi:4-amino-4-deoxy-L-arabinose transferase-like glycosyltransferase